MKIAEYLDSISPTPWEAEQEVENGITLRNGGGDVLAEIQTEDDEAPDERHWALARLLKSSPVTFDALLRIATASHDPVAVEIAREAIERADKDAR